MSDLVQDLPPTEQVTESRVIKVMNNIDGIFSKGISDGDLDQIGLVAIRNI